MLDDRRIERWIADLTALAGAEAIDRAREEFHRRAGPFEVGDAWYEERIRFFFDWYLCDFGGAQRWLEGSPDAAAEDRRLARACATSARSLYTVREVDPSDPSTVLLDDRLGGGRFSAALPPGAAGLSAGETFDGRLLALDRLVVSGGIIFHPAQTHEALDALLDRLGPLEGERAPVLDGLLRMRMRLDRFTSIRARHLYRLEALHDPDILSAGWARKTT